MKGEKSLAIIGHTGFVGGNVLNHFKKKKFKISKFNSKNIKNIHKKKYHSLVFAGLPATKWKINLNPKKDIENIKKILKLLKTIKVDQFILISTIDIYNHKEPYGFNRLNFEKEISRIFNKLIIIRLPALFGPGLKKNIVYDLLNNNEVYKINPNSYYQWLDISNLNIEIDKILNKKKFASGKIIELFTEPIKTQEIFDIAKIYINSNLKFKKTIKYNQIPKKGYYRKSSLVINDLKNFVNKKLKI
jgi:nucleoside-diphosphate-sugar epimerase